LEAGAGDLPALPATSGAMALVVTADVPATDLAHLARLGDRPSSLTVVVVDRAGTLERSAAPGTTVVVGPGQPLAPAWNRAMAAAGVLRGAAG
jgi:hypothetical protein